MKNNFLEVPKFINSDLEFKKVVNKYEVMKDDFPDKFIVNLFYIEKNLCLFKIRRIDSEYGWDKDLKIILYTKNKSKNDIISIGKSFKNTKTLEIYINIDLVVNENNNLRSKNIIQTRDYNFKNFIECENFYRFISKNIEYKFYNFDKNGRRDFLTDNYKDFLNIYDTIIDTNLRKKIFILCYVNYDGGIYIDDSLEFDEISYIDLEDNLIKINNDNFYLLNCKKNSINIKKLFNDIESKENLNFRNYIEDIKDIELDIKVNETIKFLYYDKVFTFKNHKILILNKDLNNNYDFIIEEMEEGYYLLKDNNGKDFDDLNIKYINLNNNLEGYLKDENYKLSKKNLKIFKIKID